MKTQKSFEDQNHGVLYLVPTPIGNLEDMTFRAIRVMKEVDYIAAEDTRNTQKLLNHFEIQTPQISFHEHNKQYRVQELVERLLNGENLAQVSDAGMPSISDPGVELVKAAIKEGLTVVPLPGANAALPALVASGLSTESFFFYGFLPRKKKELSEKLDNLNHRQETLIFYESPHRLKQLLEQMLKVFGEDRKIVLARELSKRYEEFIRGSMIEVLEWSKNNQVRGEFVVVVEGNFEAEKLEEIPQWEAFTIKEHVENIIEEKNIRSKDAIKEVALLRDLPKREVYAKYHEI